MLAGSIQASRPAAPQHTKIREPDPFNGSDPKKLQPFLVQLELNFRNRSDMFQLDMYKVNYMLSFLKGTALDYFELSLMDPHTNPTWSNNYDKLISELQTNFGPFDIEADAENELERLKMCDNQKVAKYIVSFQQLSSKVNWGDTALHHQFYNRLPGRIKDEITRVGKPDNLNQLHTLVQSIDARYWERHSEISRENATSSSKADKSNNSPKPNSQSDNRKNNSGSTKATLAPTTTTTTPVCL